MMIHYIYGDHGEYRFPGELDDSRIFHDGRGDGNCVRRLDPRTEWMAASTAASTITGNQVNGWLFWKLRATDRPIDELRANLRRR